MATINSTIGTSTTVWAFGGAAQRYAFYALGRFWVFYSDGTNEVWRTSTDGETWSDATAVRALAVGYLCSVWFDGTYVHYVATIGTDGADIFYRMGLIVSDGTITWQAVEQTAVAIAAGTYAHDPTISVDSNGYPWIAYAVETIATDEHLAYITKSKTKDGTWTEEDVLFTAPYQFSASTFELSTGGIACWCAAVPLSGGKVYAIANPNYDPVAETEGNFKGRLWDGAAWGDEETVAAASGGRTIMNAQMSPVVDSQDNIHLTYMEWDGTRYTYHTIRTASTGLWSTPTLLRSPDPNGGGAYTTIDTNDILYHFWCTEPTAKHIYYRRYVNEAWEAVTDWITETDAFTDEYSQYISAAAKGYSGRIIFTYCTLTASPYNVKMAALELIGARGWAQK